MSISNVTWVDVNTNYGEDTDPELVRDIKAINNALFNLLSCKVGTRPFVRDFGCDLISALFEPSDKATADFIDLTLFQAIRRWEPRIQLDTARSSVTPGADSMSFDVVLVYTILRTRQTGSYTFTLRKL